MLRTRTVWMRRLNSLLSSVLPLSYEVPPFFHRRKKQFCSVAFREQNDSTPVDVEARVSKLVHDLCGRGISVCEKKQVTSLYQLLVDLNIKADTIDAQLLEMPDLLSYSRTAWANTCEVMVDNGIPSLKILQTIALQPGLLKVKPSVLNSRLLQYRQIGIRNLNFLNIAVKNPVVLSLEVSRVKKRLRSLDGVFPHSDLKTVIRNNPNILTDDWDEIMAKILYIHKEMGLEQPQIIVSRCLRKSLLHIKTRHLFLLRAGLYKKPNLLRNKQSHRWNASLIEIMETSDRQFANRVAHLTEMEYAMFKDMMAAEEMDDTIYDSDEDSDEEDPKLSYQKR